MNFVVFTLESQINTDFEINVSNEVKYIEYNGEISYFMFVHFINFIS